MKLPSGLTLLIDGDMIVYAAAFAAEKRFYDITRKDEPGRVLYTVDSAKEANAWIKGQNDPDEFEKELRVMIEEKEHAMQNAKSLLNKCMEQCRGEDHIIYLSPSEGNFREKIAVSAPYKGNRWGPDRREKERAAGNWIEWLDATEGKVYAQEKPFHYNAVRDYLVSHHNAVIAVGQEADDELGIQQMKHFDHGRVKQSHAGSVICTLDKDLRTVPGFHYNWNDEEVAWVSRGDARYNFYVQVLTGDKSDNITGVPAIAEATLKKHGLRRVKGIGPATAEKILEGCTTERDYQKRVVDVYMDYALEYGDKYLVKYRINECGALVRVRQKEGEIWQLPDSFTP